MFGDDVALVTLVSTREMTSLRVGEGAGLATIRLEWSGKKIGKIINTFAQSFISWLVGTFLHSYFTKILK